MTITEELERIRERLAQMTTVALDHDYDRVREMNVDLQGEVIALKEKYRNHIAVRATTGMASDGGFEASLYVQSEQWCWDSTEKGALDALQSVFDKR
jgi:Ni,Fe-hydrogenase III large subunit